MQSPVRSCTVFADNHRMGGVVPVLLCQVFLESSDVASIPSLVQVPSYDIGDVAYAGLVIAVAAMECHGADARRVFLLEYLFQPFGK